jgi:NADPH:quinone reductase-like Zn-dependent oxidoreductase
MAELPKSYRAVELTSYDGGESLHVVEKPMPKLGPGEVLVKVAASPINPSDLAFLKGRYGVKKPLPCVPGFECSGRVVAAGRGLGKALVGRRVSCSALEDHDGTWAEYLVTKASRCFPLRPKIDDEQGAMLLVNPMTAWVLIDRARKEKHKAIAQTAAASALGRMMVRLGRKHKLPMVNVVRRPEQVSLLRDLGAEHVIDTSRPDADAQMKELFRSLGVTLSYDAVSGDLPDRLLTAMPRGRKVVSYGALSEGAAPINPSSLIFGGRSVEGFWLATWLAKAKPVDQARAALGVQTMRDAFRSEIAARQPLDRAREAVIGYAAAMTAGKTLITP